MPDAGTPLQRLVYVYVNAVTERGGLPDSDVDWAARKIGELLHRGVPEPAIADGIRRMVERGKVGGYMLGTFVSEVMIEQKDAPDKALLDTFLDAHDGRWPTGVMFKRGSHGGTYVADPLGYDRADYGQWKPPRRQEVVDALRSQTKAT